MRRAAQIGRKLATAVILTLLVGFALRVAGEAAPRPACRFIEYFQASGYSAESVSLWERVAYSLILASTPAPKAEPSPATSPS